MKDIMLIMALAALALSVPLAFAEMPSAASVDGAIGGMQKAFPALPAGPNGTGAAVLVRSIMERLVKANVSASVKGMVASLPAASSECASARQKLEEADKEIELLKSRVSELEAKLKGAYGGPGAPAVPFAGGDSEAANATGGKMAPPSAEGDAWKPAAIGGKGVQNATNRTEAGIAGKAPTGMQNAAREHILNISNWKTANGAVPAAANEMVDDNTDAYARIMNVLGVYVQN